MTDPEHSQSHQEQTPDEKKTFDMYHFFSRWDMLLAAILIVFLIILALYLIMSGPKVA